MFKKILVPISSEFYSKNVVKRGITLAEMFHSSITLVYIIEEKTLYQTEKLSDAHRTVFDKTETQKDIVRKIRLTADNIVFEDAQHLFKERDLPFEKKVINGEFSTVVLSEIEQHHYDLVVMGYEKGCMLNYRLIDNTSVPIWIETEGEYQNTILAVCSNLAPNQKVPEISITLSKTLGWDLHMIYVIDTEDAVEVDAKGTRSTRKTKRELLFSGQTFAEKMSQKGIEIKTIQGSLENEVPKAARALNAGLVIIGREQKRKGKLGLPVRNIKRKIIEKCKYSLLFIN